MNSEITWKPSGKAETWHSRHTGKKTRADIWAPVNGAGRHGRRSRLYQVLQYQTVGRPSRDVVQVAINDGRMVINSAAMPGGY